MFFYAIDYSANKNCIVYFQSSEVQSKGNILGIKLRDKFAKYICKT